MSGGCDPFSIPSQNRWQPYGTTIRAEPERSATPIGNFDPNELITVDGWVRGDAAYPTNRPPWNSDVWLHVAGNRGWVSFAGVGADPTTNGPTGLDPEGGRPVPTDPECSGTVR